MFPLLSLLPSPSHFSLIIPHIMSSPSRSPSLSPECEPRCNKKHHGAHPERERSMSPATCDCRRRDKWQHSPSPSSPSTQESRKHRRSHSRGRGHSATGSWGAHPNLPFICHTGTCDACQAYGEHLTLASFCHDEDFLEALTSLKDNLTRLLDHSPAVSWERWCHEVDECANRLREENDTLRAKLVSLGGSQQPPPQPQGEGPSSQHSAPPTESFSGGRVWGTVPQLLTTSHWGEIPHISSSFRPQAPMPSQRDLFLTSSTPAPHKPTYIEGDTHVEVKLGQPALLERLTSVESTLDNAKGKLFPSFSGTEQPRETLVLGHENYENRQVRALFLRYQQSLYTFINEVARLILHNLDAGVPIPLPSSTGP